MLFHFKGENRKWRKGKNEKIVRKSGTLFQTIPDLAYNYILFVLHTYCIVLLRL